MGYTHYWDRPSVIDRDTYKAIRSVLVLVLESLPSTTSHFISICNGNGNGPLDLSDPAMFRFNGDGELAHETFAFDRVAEKWEFCKTAHKPYDVAVCACLSVIADMDPEVEVRSDGLPDTEGWVEGARIASQVLGYDVPVPVKR